ncbi:MAG TPA: tetratricopeptide repeat protein [Blastocatellia bacterium]|nr:tetratricopeptide repeat protein [Blastocatellia bacterium]
MDAISALTKYKIIEKLGEGGMGVVYKAEDLALLRTVAIKTISKQGRRSQDAETRFLREARAASSINHPNIVTVYEIGETDQHAYIVMEYVEGESLRDLITRRGLDGAAVLDISFQICDALSEAHRQGVIHRDIKPENILRTERGRVKLLDFGLAKAIERSLPDDSGKTVAENLTESGVVMGTLSYMSPEQLRGQPLDHRTDLFSFGIVLCEMITGKLPFAGANSFEIAASILKEAPRMIEEVPEGLNRGITAIVDRLLEKGRANRYASFETLKQALESLQLDFGEHTLELKQSQGNVGASQGSSGHSRIKSPPTVLVLPLETVGSEEGGSFIGVGLAHAITTDLAKIGGLSVLSKAAGAGRVDVAGRGARELAHELGATILLEGEIMRAGQMIGVMARLTDAKTGRVIWGEQFRGDAADLFSIQDAVCDGVAAALKLSVSSDERDQTARPATIDIDAFEFYSKGRAFLERREVKENIDFAIQMFEEALKLDRDFALAQAGAGEAYWHKYEATLEREWVDRAIAASDSALRLDPRQAQVHISLGIIHHGTGKMGKAIEEFERAIELQPMSDAAHRWLGRCYTQEGDMERAIAYFDKSIQLRPGYWENYSRLGFCYYTFGHYVEAAEQYRRMITIQPDNYLGYDNLGAMYIYLGHYEDAVTMQQRAIEIYPNHRSYSNQGTAYFFLGRYEEAIAAYNTAISLNPRDDLYYGNLGDAYSRVGREQDAHEQFRLASDLLKEHLRINQDDAQLLGRLAICQAKLRLQPEARASVSRAISLEPRNTTLMYQKAVVYALIGENERALEYLSEALAHGYSRSEAERDPDLEALRGRIEYKALFT